MQLAQMIRSWRKRVLQFSILAALLLAGVAITLHNAPAGTQPSGPRTDPIPELDVDDPEKSVLVRLNFQSQTDVSLNSTEVVQEQTRMRIGDPPLLEIRTYDNAGSLVEEFNAWHPLWAFVENEDGSESRVTLDSATATFVFPFSSDLSRMSVVDVELGQEVESVDLDPVVSDYCAQHPDDPDCVTDLSISKADTPDPAVAGESLEYTLTVTNNGANPAHGVQVTDSLPAGVTYAGSNPACVEGQPGTVTCDVSGPLPAGESADISIPVEVASDLVSNNGGSATLVNQASVELTAGSDPNSQNNSTSEETLVESEADLAILSFDPADPEREILLGEPTPVTLTKTVTNHGPSGPVDAALDVAATVPASADGGIAVEPAPENPGVVPALGVGEERTVSETFLVTCQQPGSYTVSVTNTIAPQSADDTDPNAGNNEGQAQVTVECVVPAAINIRPGDHPNTANTRSRRQVIPLAVLTTEAGEYDLPLALDARTIDLQRVRFGPRDVVFDADESGGASPLHNRGHLEDSVELDEVTRDGDADLVLHFFGHEAGLDRSDVEACVTGTYTTEVERSRGGTTVPETFTFFGCDSIELRP